MAEEKKLFKVTVDNITIDVEPGTTVLQAARKIGGDVAPPAMCYYTHLKGSGVNAVLVWWKLLLVQQLIRDLCQNWSQVAVPM
jgi:hypothetical protein